ncbi:cobyric acid synthase CobQ [Floricoccus tropicus]|uniref:Cobyric acid synthase n=1 Tax=Floricoccus tropicus TaxID=1859473 RepID=A0A1E8GNT6_9LACT|nr:cobyric acid synthase [Floricoccus tropicus]OFI49921.1 cobyric acid synthase CobQ [Floricoccus tropicus]
MGKSIMIQGTVSDAGKSIVVAALCRIFWQDGLRSFPFKSQNMSLNSYITSDGHEMGRAQVFQAESAGVEPDVRMNPILLKPTSDTKSQVIYKGKVLKDMDAVDYFAFKPVLIEEISNIYKEISLENDVVVIEGAGSPAEINLNKDDFVNMGMAKIADSPVILVADIDKGGVFASIYGTIKILEKEDSERIKGIIINKFRGDISLLESGLKMIEDLTGVPVIGVIPYGKFDIEDEDSMALYNINRQFNYQKDLDIAVIALNKMSNFTDFKSLEMEEDVSVRYVLPGDNIGNPDIVILPGSKDAMADMQYLKNSGFDKEIISLREKGATIFGICGGYQILGSSLSNPLKTEGNCEFLRGLGLLNVDTVFTDTKTTTQSEGKIIENKNYKVKGYEIHMGKTVNNKESAFSVIDFENNHKTNRLDGAMSSDLKVQGTYLHGIFDNREWRRDFLNQVRVYKGLLPITHLSMDYNDFKNQEYDKLANLVRDNIDMKKVYKILEGQSI